MEGNLKQLREAAGLSLSAIGEMCGKTKATMHALEKDTANPTLTTAYSIARVLDKSVYEIWPNVLEFTEEIKTIRKIKLD